jgi:hypothetical protein
MADIKDLRGIQFRGATPLFLAARNEFTEIASILLDHKADPNRPTGLLAGHGSLETPLMCSAQNNNPAMMRILLEHKANPNATNAHGLTALHYLASANRGKDVTECASLLIKAGAQVNAGTADHITPLKYAQNQPSEFTPNFLKLLKENGAIEDLPDTSGIFAMWPGLSAPLLIRYKDLKGLNQFTGLEGLGQIFFHQQAPQEPGFPDLTQIKIHRVSLVSNAVQHAYLSFAPMASSNMFDCSRDMPLEWGDTIVIPYRDHRLSEAPSGMNATQKGSLAQCIQRTVKLSVPGGIQALNALEADLADMRTKYGEAHPSIAALKARMNALRGLMGPPIAVNLDGLSQPYLSMALGRPEALQVLRSSSDFTRVKVTRQVPEQGKITRTFDVEAFRKSQQGFKEDFWLKADDLIEVPDRADTVAGGK